MINIAEILKDAPQGLKLYSLVHGDVTLNEIILNNEYPVRTICSIGSPSTFTKHGKFIKDLEEDAECILFPSKEHKSWNNWQEVLFQCGDVIVSQNETPIGFQTFLCYKNDDRGYLAYGVDGGKNYITPSYYRYATQEEREQFFKVLNNNGYTWNDNTKQMEKSLQQYTPKHDCLGCVNTRTKGKPFTINDFKPFDMVLVRDTNDEEWKCDLFSHAGKYIMNCVSTTWKQCIPYCDETKHLLGTTDDCPDKYKTW